MATAIEVMQALANEMKESGIDAAMQLASSVYGYTEGEPNRESLRDNLLRLTDYRHTMDKDVRPVGA